MNKPLLPRRWPLIPTILVVASALIMVMLGFWQLRRDGQKQLAIMELRENPSKPTIAYPFLGPITPEDMFRRSSVNCLSVESWKAEAGRASDGNIGFRYVAHCRTGAEGPGALVSLGVADRPDLSVDWQGGIVSGWITREKDHSTMLERALGRAPVLLPMLIVEQPPESLPAGQLKPMARPTADNVTNNHMAYAVQWFFFAAVAVVIYILALRRRGTKGTDGS